VTPPNSASPATSYRLTIPRRSLRLRLIALGYGGGLLLWSSLEDNNVLPAALLGGGLALLLLTLWLTGASFGGKTLAGRRAVLGAALFGAAAGFGAALATAALMLLKDGLHAHLFPDYPFGMIVDILARAPLWALAGLLASVGALLAWWAIKEKDLTQRRGEETRDAEKEN
jgi:hypothetical protein